MSAVALAIVGGPGPATAQSGPCFPEDQDPPVVYDFAVGPAADVMIEPALDAVVGTEFRAVVDDRFSPCFSGIVRAVLVVDSGTVIQDLDPAPGSRWGLPRVTVRTVVEPGRIDPGVHRVRIIGFDEHGNPGEDSQRVYVYGPMAGTCRNLPPAGPSPCTVGPQEP